MKRTRHTPEQIVRKLREADGALSAGVSAGQSAPPGASVWGLVGRGKRERIPPRWCGGSVSRGWPTMLRRRVGRRIVVTIVVEKVVPCPRVRSWTLEAGTSGLRSVL